VDVNFTVGRGHVEWLEMAAGTFGVPQSTPVALAIACLAKNCKI
jgi:hypothetical protein